MQFSSDTILKDKSYLVYIIKIISICLYILVKKEFVVKKIFIITNISNNIICVIIS